jgi:hypothetical protein
VSPVKYELGSYIPEDDILHSDRREYLTSYTLSVIPQAEVFVASRPAKTGNCVQKLSFSSGNITKSKHFIFSPVQCNVCTSAVSRALSEFMTMTLQFVSSM